MTMWQEPFEIKKKREQQRWRKPGSDAQVLQALKFNLLTVFRPASHLYSLCSKQ
jgi:hypothetical protein